MLHNQLQGRGGEERGRKDVRKWLYLQPRGKNKGRKMDGEHGGLGYRGHSEEEGGGGGR